ncbi:MAG: hypothetical protein N2Z22_06845 [Turneriella sp.]|nr:hypothetical protein [Leptospiraceae bacterium]MCX7633030.1 hypothetical protein [Turneriella sp.]
MQSLGEILRQRDPAFLRYLARKTQYLISHENEDFIRRFWQHLILDYHPAQVLGRLNKSEKRTFWILLQQFARDDRPQLSARYARLEKKIPWVLEHPEGGYFIPYEILKTLMPKNRLIPFGYLFQLLYALPPAELQSLGALLARSHLARDALAGKWHHLDHALAIYIWIAQSRNVVKASKTAENFPTIWQYLEHAFPYHQAEIEEWQFIMQSAGKGFYRSLLLLRGAELLKSYIASLHVVPVAARRNRIFPARALRYVVPWEFRTRLPR